MPTMADRAAAAVNKAKAAPIGKSLHDGRMLLFRELIEKQGITVKEAGKLVGYTASYAYQLSAKFRKEGNEISKELPEDLSREIDRRAKMLLKGKTWGKIKDVKCSTVAKLVVAGWDRKYPSKRDEDAAPSFSFTQINLNSIRLDPDTKYGGPAPNSRETDVEGELVEGSESNEVNKMEG